MTPTTVRVKIFHHTRWPLHPPNDVLDELIDIAASAMYAAHRNGGKQPCHVLVPPLTALDGTDGSKGYPS
jgi:hypothetical protein